VARRRNEAEPGQQLELAVDRLVAQAGRLDPLADRVVVLRARVLELLPSVGGLDAEARRSATASTAQATANSTARST
jgi:hypothetical protein